VIAKIQRISIALRLGAKRRGNCDGVGKHKRRIGRPLLQLREQRTTEPIGDSDIPEGTVGGQIIVASAYPLERIAGGTVLRSAKGRGVVKAIVIAHRI